MFSPETTCACVRKVGATAFTLTASRAMTRPSSSVRRKPLPCAPFAPETAELWGKTSMKLEPSDWI